ncbi:hypothetical protein CH262_08315 [Rhodococcus sp. 05-2255-1e]|uniref:excisionase family DNA-binding protein n=1 Tax=Rhodococcus sp. 05-2255-1e TaxID=2022495 RepID=UPI000B9C7070|nr:excisionase family DNA-binding protein [Rhodococcus sp. 05-2255-1e]OZE26167.1 hypothetical protein CH262_08315 [Rhodococcus sp. 05-2255-1e]
MASKRLRSIEFAADYLGVDPRTIRTYIADGRLPAWRMGPRLVKVDESDLDNLLTPIGRHK